MNRDDTDQLSTIYSAATGDHCSCAADVCEGSLDGDSIDMIEDKAITMASMKVSGISGDARRVLDICR